MRLLALILLAVLAAVLVDQLHRRSLEAERIEAIDFAPTNGGGFRSAGGAVVLPTAIGAGPGRALRLTFPGRGEITTFELNIRASGARFDLLGASGAPVELRNCATPGNETVTCRATLQLPDEQRTATLVSRGETTIRSLDVSVLQSRREVQIGNLPVVTVACLLALLAPLFWRLSVPGQTALAALLGMGWLALANLQLCLLTGVALALAYGGLQVIVRSRNRQRPLILMVLASVVALFAVKLIGLPTGPDTALMSLCVPLGFSYLIIRVIDLSFKAYARQIAVISPREYIAYLLFPPTLAAGPIASLPQWREGADFYRTFEDRAWGLARILSGIAKKTLADLIYLHFVMHNMESGFYGPDKRHVAVVLFASAVHVYLDFSGYSDIVIGLARWWGWRLPENFNLPFVSRSMREFWQRWHMSLTQWVTRHVFMLASMEVRRLGPLSRAVAPPLAVLLTIGLWHGLELVWVLWALHHLVGILLGDAAATLTAPVLGLIPTGPWRRAAGAGIAAGGIGFVWFWFALSQAFTTTSSAPEAVMNYLHLLSLGLL